MIEHELKFALTASMAAEFEQRAAIGLTQAPQRIWSRYFDTPAGDLMNASATLRLRRTPGGYLQAVKTAGGGAFERCEWEVAVAGDAPEFDALPPQGHPVGALVRECFGLLAPVFETDFERQVRLVRPQAGVTLEIACDRGEIRAGQRSERIAEVEIERKEGSEAAFYHYAMQWSTLHQAQLLLGSKALRGLQLAGLQTARPAAVELPPRTPPADVPVAAAAQEILTGHLEHFVANLPAAVSGTGPDGVRELYTALRRFRAAIRFLALRRPPLLEDGPSAGDDLSATWQDLDRRARNLAHAAAPVHAVDGCEAGMLAHLRQSFPEDAAVLLLGRSLGSARERARLGLREAMASPDVTAFVMRARAAVASLPPDRWTEKAFAAFAAGRLEGLARRAGRRARRAKQDRQWHDVRAAVGILACSLQSCRALQVPAGTVEDAVASLSGLQSSLGMARQLAQARGLLTEALAGTAAAAETAARAAALVDGYFACARRLEAPESLRAALLASIRRLLPLPGRPRNAGKAVGAAPEAAPGQAGQSRRALRLSS